MSTALTGAELRNYWARKDLSYQDTGHPALQRTVYANDGSWVWDDLYCTLRASGIDHEPTIRMVEDAIRKAVGRPPIWPVTPPPGPTTALPGPFQIRGNTFTTATAQPVIPRLCHFGEALSLWCHDEAECLKGLDEVQGAAYHGLRTWINLNVQDRGGDDYWAGRAVGPEVTTNYPRRLDLFLEACAERGLLVHTAAGDLKHYSNQQEDTLFGILADAIATVGPEHIALVEGANEIRDVGDDDDQHPDEIARLVQIVRQKHPQLLYALSAYTGTEDREVLRRWTPSWMAFYLYHGFRGGHAWDKMRHAWDMGYTDRVRRLGWSGEGPGPGRWVSSIEYQDELNNEAMAMLAVLTAMGRQAYCYMSGPGVKYTEPFSAMPGFAAVPRILARLPQDLMGYQAIFHGGKAWSHTRILAVPDNAGDNRLRCDHNVAETGDFVVGIYGESRMWQVPVARSFTGVVVNPVTLSEVPVARKAGSTLEVGFDRGRVLIGHLD